MRSFSGHSMTSLITSGVVFHLKDKSIAYQPRLCVVKYKRKRLKRGANQISSHPHINVKSCLNISPDHFTWRHTLVCHYNISQAAVSSSSLPFSARQVTLLGCDVATASRFGGTRPSGL